MHDALFLLAFNVKIKEKANIILQFSVLFANTASNFLLYTRRRAYMDSTVGYIDIIKNDNCKWRLHWELSICMSFLPAAAKNFTVR